MDNPYYVEPINILPGFNALAQGIEKRSQAEAAKARSQQAMDSLTSEDTEKLNTWLSENPENVKIAQSYFSSRLGMEHNTLSDLGKRMFLGDSSTELISEAEKHLQEGKNTPLVKMAYEATKDPEGAKQFGERLWSIYDTEGYKQYKDATKIDQVEMPKEWKLYQLGKENPEFNKFLEKASKDQVSQLQKTGSVIYQSPDGSTRVGVGSFDPKTGKMSFASSVIPGVVLTKEGETPWEQTGRKVEEERGKEIATSQEKRVSDLISAGVDAAEVVPTLKRSIELLNKTKTGGFSYVKNEAARVFGVQGTDEGELSYNLGIAMLKKLKPILGPQFTEKDRAAIEKIEASFSKNTEVNKRLLNQALEIFEKKASRARRAAMRRGDTDTASDIDELLKMSLSPKKQGRVAPQKRAGKGGMTDQDALKILMGK